VQDTAGLKEYAMSLGFDTVGVCAPDRPTHYNEYRDWIEKGFHGSMSYLERHLTLKGDPAKLLPGVRSIVAVSLNYNQPNPIEEGFPRIARYALGRDYHKVIKKKLAILSARVTAEHPDSACRPCVDSAPIMERDYAHAAGLGWFGKNTMLIDSRRGSWFFIGLLLTTVDFQFDAPAAGGCGTCRACIEACPTGAIVNRDGRWQVDAKSCISYLTIEHKGEVRIDTAGWAFGCDICQEVCPFNEPRESQPLRARTTNELDFKDRKQWPSLTQLAQVASPEWDVLTRGSAVRRAGLDGLKRNARLCLESFKTKPS
jgi:epoxyqueuosine reductase